jgi:hypothetical protein
MTNTQIITNVLPADMDSMTELDLKAIVQAGEAATAALQRLAAKAQIQVVVEALEENGVDPELVTDAIRAEIKALIEKAHDEFVNDEDRLGGIEQGMKEHFEENGPSEDQMLEAAEDDWADDGLSDYIDDIVAEVVKKHPELTDETEDGEEDEEGDEDGDA